MMKSSHTTIHTIAVLVIKNFNDNDDDEKGNFSVFLSHCHWSSRDLLGNLCL